MDFSYLKKFNTPQIKRFIISGGSATLCHLGTMAVLIWLGVNAAIATSVGMVAGAVYNYIFQYYYTFNSNQKHHKSFSKYVITVSIYFVSNLLLFTLFHNMLQYEVFISQLLTSAIVAVQNYIIYKKFVFLREDAAYEA